ncbi:MAG: glycosyltransferase [Acidimicrobiales bacterium]|nr:glycosyltransferase [Acidimicrobiales bacterium]
MSEASTTHTRSPLNVLVVASELPPGPGGIGAHAYELSVALAAQDHGVSLLGCQHYCSSKDRELFNVSSPIPVITLEDQSNPALTAMGRYRQLLNAIDTSNPDVVLASGGRVLWLAALACKRRSMPWIAVIHGSELGGASASQRLTRWALMKANRVVAVSQFTAELANKNLNVPQNHISVIHNGADGKRFSPDPTDGREFRENSGIGNQPMILTVGNVTERKGQHQVVEALPHLLKTVDAQYVVVGRPTNAEQLVSLAKKLGVKDNLTILGQQPPSVVLGAHRAADVFAMTSTNTASGDVEGYGIAVVEAALCGVPAVVSKGTGAEEAVINGVTGLAVASRPEAIADALSQLLTNHDLRNEMGRAACRRAQDEGTWESRAEAYGDLLDEVANGSKPRLVVVSHTEHYTRDDGTVVGFGPTLRELDQLATLTSELIHVAPLYKGPPPGMALPYTNPRIRHVAAPVAGGPNTKDRIFALRVVPSWVRIINRELRQADAVHVRAPAGIAMVALGILAVRGKPKNRWVKYAGNWMPDRPDAYTYRLQRWWLKKGLARGPVTVNGRWDNQPEWVFAFDNPTLTEAEIEAGAAASAIRSPGPPYRAIFVGRLEKPKGVHIAVETILELRKRGVDIELDLIGDGALRGWAEDQIKAAGNDSVRLHGWLTRKELEGFLTEAHVLLLPSQSEGFPKVVAEAMAFGCVPFTTAVSAMGQTLGETGGAVVLDANEDWVETLERHLNDESLTVLSAEGVRAANRFSYATYLGRVRELAERNWSLKL